MPTITNSATNGKQRSPADEIKLFVECVYDPNDVVEIRCLPRPDKQWSKACNLHKQADQLTRVNATGQNIYFGANPRRAHGLSGDENVPLARCFFVDFDTADDGSKGCSVDHALDRIRRAGLPDPTLVLNSGNGCHIYWRLSEPVTDIEEWSSNQKKLIAVLGSDKSIHNGERIMRSPGFLNVKDAKNPKPCTIYFADPSRVYDVSIFANTKHKTPSTLDKNGVPCFVSPVTKTRIAEKLPEVINLNRNSALTQIGGYLRRGGLSEREILATLQAANQDRCSPPLDHSEVAKVASSVMRYRPVKSLGATDFIPFPVDCLPAVMRRFVSSASRAIGCDQSYVALVLLVVAAAAIGTSRVIRLKRSWFEPPVLWGAVVGLSGTNKSAPIEKVTEALKKRQRQKFAEYESALEEYEAESLRYQQAVKDRKRGEPLPERPKEPFCQRYWTDDCTLESLTMLHLQNPKGLLLATDELTSLWSGFNQYKSGKGSDEPKYLNMHGARDTVVDRKGSKKPIYLRRPALSIIGGIQPDILRTSLSPDRFASGFASRWLLVYPPTTTKQWSETEIGREVESEWSDTIDGLLDLEQAYDEDGYSKPTALALDPDAKKAFIEFFNEHNSNLPDDNNLRAAYAKLEGACARLALVIHCVKVVSNDFDATGSNVIDVRSIQTGITLARWFANEAERVYAALNHNDAARERSDLISVIQEHGGTITIRQLQSARRSLYPKSDDAELALNDLVKSQLGTWENIPSGDSGGRPTRAFSLRAKRDTKHKTQQTPKNTEVLCSDKPEIDPNDLLLEAANEMEDYQ